MDSYNEFHRFFSRDKRQMKLFEALPDTSSKVRCIQSFLMEKNKVPKVEFRHPKNDAESKLHRDAANKLFKQRKFVDALVGYNRALCFAAVEGLSFGYANRSAAYFELELYEECLENIHLARDAGYPTHLLSKLVLRETKCREAMGRRSVADNRRKYQPKLSYPVSAENPSLADSIELVVNEKYGRHFIAKRKLKVGDIVVLDRPYQVYLINDHCYEKCANCLAEKQLNLIPCPGCTKTMFCSRLCLEAAKKFHKTLCPIVDRIFKEPSNIKFFALKILLSLMRNFGSIEALTALHASRLVKNTGLQKNGNDEKTRQINAMDVFHAMEPAVFEALDLENAFFMAIVYTLLMDCTDLAKELLDVTSQNMFLDLFHRYIKLIDRSAFTTDTLCRQGSKLQKKNNLSRFLT
jgi:MYND finger